MSDLPRDVRFSDDDLATWIRRHPEVWRYAASITSDPNAPDPDVADSAGSADDRCVDEIIDKVLVGRSRRSASRRRRVVGGACVIAVVTGGAVGAAAWFRSGQPSAPEAGILCRATAAVDADAIKIAPGVDPVDGCRQVWATGQLSDDDDAMPALTACIGSNGAIDVFPGDPTVCEALGLADADPTLAPENESIIAVQDRLTNEINAGECRTVRDVLTLAEDIVAESGLAGWQVVIEPGTEAGTCGKAGLDGTTHTVTIFDLPQPPQPETS